MRIYTAKLSWGNKKNGRLADSMLPHVNTFINIRAKKNLPTGRPLELHLDLKAGLKNI